MQGAARTVAAVAAVVGHRDVTTWYAGAMAELEAAVGVAVTGPPGGSYDNALFEQERGHALVYLPTAAPPRTGRVHPATLPAAELAVTTHVGEHDGIEVTYGELGTWVVENAMSVAGPVREVYVVGPRDAERPCCVAHRDRLAGLSCHLRRSVRRGVWSNEAYALIAG